MDLPKAERLWDQAQELVLLNHVRPKHPELSDAVMRAGVRNLMAQYVPSRRFARDWMARHVQLEEVCLELFAGHAEVLGPLALAERVQRVHVVQDGESAEHLVAILRQIPAASNRVLQRRLPVHASTWDRALPDEPVSRLFLFRTGMMEGLPAMDNSSVRTTLNFPDLLTRVRAAGISHVTVVDGVRDQETSIPHFMNGARHRVHQSGWHVADSTSNPANRLYAFDLVPGE